MKPDFTPYIKKGHFVLSNGKITDKYYDIKEMVGDPDKLRTLTALIRSWHPLGSYDVIIGLELGGIALAVSLSMNTGVPFAIIRKKTNEHGMGKRIEGSQIKGRCIVVDDVKTTGKSLDDAVQYLESNGYTVVGEATVIDRTDELNGDMQ